MIHLLYKKVLKKTNDSLLHLIRLLYKKKYICTVEKYTITRTPHLFCCFHIWQAVIIHMYKGKYKPKQTSVLAFIRNNILICNKLKVSTTTGILYTITYFCNYNINCHAKLITSSSSELPLSILGGWEKINKIFYHSRFQVTSKNQDKFLTVGGRKTHTLGV